MSLDFLTARTGRQRGISTLQDPEHGIAESAESQLVVTPVLGGRFVRLDYDWSYRGAPQEGSLLVGHEPNRGAASAYWVDSWHMGHAAMTCAGTIEPGRLSVRGSYAVPGHPDWGWQIDLEPLGPAGLRLTMYNISPEGEEYPAVDADYMPTD